MAAVMVVVLSAVVIEVLHTHARAEVGIPVCRKVHGQRQGLLSLAAEPPPQGTQVRRISLTVAVGGSI